MKNPAFKRTFDILFSIALIILTSPLMALACILCLIDGHKNPLFTQVRLGQHCYRFTIFKFRTMHDRAHRAGNVPQHVGFHSEGITAIGRFMRATSLDELPQLFNILKGDMAFIGPRPHALSYAQHYASIAPDYYARYQVRPGLAGLVQVTPLRNLTEEADHIRARVASDLHYVRSMSIGLDLAIFAAAALIVVKALMPSMLSLIALGSGRLVSA